MMAMSMSNPLNQCPTPTHRPLLTPARTALESDLAVVRDRVDSALAGWAEGDARDGE